MPRTDTHPANDKRIGMIRKAVEFLRAAESGLTTHQLTAAMGTSASAVKTYLYALTHAGIIERDAVVKTRGGIEKVSCVIATKEKVENFLLSLKYDPYTHPRHVGIKTKKEQEDRLARDPTRHFHVSGDDEEVKIRMSHKKVFYDQHHLPREFFATAGKEA